MKQKLQVKVEEMMDEFSKQWQPVMENLEVAEQAFDDVEGPHSTLSTVASVLFYISKGVCPCMM